MQSKNPAFANDRAFTQGGYATFDEDRGRRGAAQPSWGAASSRDMTPQQLQEMYAAPSADAVRTGRMTYDDVVVRTAGLFALLLLGAGAAWVLTPPAAVGLVLPVALVAAGLGIWAQVSKKIRPGVMLTYAVLEGAVLGVISRVFESAYDGVVVQAVLGTLAAFAVMLVAYKTRVIRATPKFVRFMVIATMGYFVFVLVNLGTSLLLGANAYDSPLGWLIGLVGVGLATFNLILDFDYIERGVRNGLPQRYAWRAAFGLTITLVWLYIEMLRLLAILRGDD